MTLFFKIVIGLLVLSLIMLCHEGGHYLAGILLKFKVLSFNIFMGPNIFSKKAKNGVNFNLKSLPLGASVEFAGELSEDSLGNEFVSSPDPQEGSDGELFFERPRWARAIVAFAGPAANFITAFIAFLVLFVISGVSVPIQADLPSEFSGLAQTAGLEPGDRILTYNGARINTTYDLASVELFAKPGQVSLEVLKPSGEKKQISFYQGGRTKPLIGINYVAEGDKLKVVAVDPRSNNHNPVLMPGDLITEIGGIPAQETDTWGELLSELTAGKQDLDLSLIRGGREIQVKTQITELEILDETGLAFTHTHNVGAILKQAIMTPFSLLKLTVKGLAGLFTGAMPLRQSLAGPVRIVKIVGDTVQGSISLKAKLESLLMLFGLLSVAIGFTQLIPLPPFDGHHLMLLAIEGARGKDLSVGIKQKIATIGFFLLIGLFLLTLYFDLLNIFV